MSRLTACPEERDLRNMIQGQAAAESVEAFAVHLEGCPGCAERLDRSLGDDTLLDAMRSQGTLADRPGDPAVPPMIERLLRLRPSAATRPDQPAEGLGGLHDSTPAAPAEACDFLDPPQAADEIGRLGSYRVLQVLGAGGMGVVFRAEDVHLKRQVALKVMKPGADKRPTARERFLREAQAAAAVEHEHVVTIHQVGEAKTATGGVPFLAMQWLKGMSLDDRLRSGGAVEPAEVVRIGRQVALGLAAAHEHGLIHRDIKPANLWLEPGGRVKILDFGLARVTADEVQLTQDGAILGTPAFMAPEQAAGLPVDPRSDLFSLGVVLYRLATGRLPFVGTSTIAVLTSLAVDHPEPPVLLNLQVPAELSDLILHLLAKDPADRPTSARVVADRLDAIGRPAAAPEATGGAATVDFTPHRPAAAAPASRPNGRMRPPVLAVALGVLALAVAAVAAVVFYLQTPDGGTVRVEITDDSIEAVLTKNGAVIKGADKGQDISVGAGAESLKIKRGDLEFETDQFVLRKGDKVTLRVELVPGKVQVVRDGKVIGEKAVAAGASDRAAAEWVLSLGGTVTIDDGKEVEVKAVKDLPAGSWTLRQVDLGDKKTVDDAAVKRLAGSKGLQVVKLNGTRVTDAGLKELAPLADLRWINLNFTGVTDAGLKELASHSGLQTLGLNGTAVTDAGVKELAPLKNLRWVNLKGTRLTAAGATALRQLLAECVVVDDVTPPVCDRAAAEWVWSVGGTVTVDDGLRQFEVAAVKDLPKVPWTVWRVQLNDSKAVDDAALHRLAGLKSLHALEIGRTPVTDAGLKGLAGLTSLELLYLNGTPITDAGVKELAALAGLKKLHLDGTLLTDAGVKGLAPLRDLELLSVNQTRLTDAGVKGLTAFNHLRVLGLGCPRVTDAGVKELAALKKLEELRLTDTQLTGTGLKDLAGLAHLRMLILGRSRLTDAGVKELAAFKGLTVLSLESTQVTDAGLKELAPLRNLAILGVGHDKVTPRGVAELRKLFPGCRFNDEELSPKAAAEWAFSLGGTVAIDDGKEQVISAAKDLPAVGWTLRKIDLRGKKGLAGPALAALGTHQTLREVDLTGTDATAEGVAALRKALPDCDVRFPAKP